MSHPTIGGTSFKLISEPKNRLENACRALMVTWQVKDSFGGMTAMCLNRAGIFHEQGVPSAVVTFAPEPNFEQISETLLSSGRLHSAVPIVNLHEYYDHEAPARMTDDTKPTPLPDVVWGKPTETYRTRDNSLFFRDYKSASHSLLNRREYFRRDGTKYLVDFSYPDPKDESKTLRRLQLFRRGNLFVQEFSTAASLYRHWLSTIVGEKTTDVIVDSKYAAAFLNNWQHPLAIKIYNFHSTHVAAGEDTLSGKLSKAHLPIINARSNWDGLVFLTKSQKDAFIRRFGDDGKTHVLSNPSRGVGNLPDRSLRDLSKVIHVGRLTEAKGVGDVIRIVHAVAKSGQPVSLDIVGEGPERENLERLVRELGLDPIVQFHGHVDNVREHLQRANVLLLCSAFEGQPLALLEAQANGCIPVAYDVNFGPRDVIEHGETGFLSARGDVQALVGIVIRLLSDENLSSRISSKAFSASASYSEEAVFNNWAQWLKRVRNDRLILGVLATLKPTTKRIEFQDDGGIDLRIGWNADDLDLDSIQLEITPRGEVASEHVFRLDPSSSSTGEATFAIPAAAIESGQIDGPLDIYVRMGSGQSSILLRLGVRQKNISLPYFTVYGNLSLK
ncbi:MAG TPA: hypothetical protein DEX36_00675 [Glutamicibacter sp.]|uniref:glycosyltransferase n=2 Tax=Glutamicibacter TaxID=1742989 RepID=UPI0002D7C556|nr:glycosyltransferase [Glutamicibacter arilaitensis]HCH46443.1 hypothetical protein [Glutamicibacter sp.]